MRTVAVGIDRLSRIFQVSPNQAAIVCLTLFSVLTAYTLIFFYRLPYFDHFDLAWYLQSYYDGSFSLADLFLPHGNSHWHAGAYAIMLPLAIWSGWNILWDEIAILAVCLYIWWMLFLIVRDTSRRLDIRGTLPLMAVLCALFVFSTDNAENLLWGWQLSAFLSVAGAVTTIFVLTRERLALRHILCAVLSILFAIYNYSPGLVLWPVGIFLVLMHPAPLRQQKLLWILLLVAAAVANALHFYTSIWLARPTSEPVDLVSLPLYWLISLGTPLTRFARDSLGLVGLIGIVVVAWFGARIYRRLNDRIDLLPYAGLVAYALGSALMISFGRTEYGLQQAVVTRYIIFTFPLWLTALLFITIDMAQRGSLLQPRLMIILLFAVTCKLYNGYYIGLRMSKVSDNYSVVSQEIVNRYPIIDSKLLLKLYPNEIKVRDHLEIMHRYRLNIFAGN